MREASHPGPEESLGSVRFVARMKRIQTAAVCGLGTMGHGIAQTLAAAGISVRCYDAAPAARESLHERIAKNLADFAAAGLMKKKDIPAILSRITVFDSETDAVRGASFVTECVAEDLGVKQEWFARIEALVPKSTILASNSSTYPISMSGAKLRHPERAIVTHWFNPPHIVPVVEVVPGPRTGEAVTKTAMALMKRIGKKPVRINIELPGFLVNRIQVAVMREVWDLVDRGVASHEDIDEAVRGTMGFRLAAIGPLEVHDFGGLDIQAKVFKNLAPEIRSSTGLPHTIQQLVEAGHYGAKTGKGFHTYTKKPLFSDRRAVDVTVGSWNFIRGVVDVTGAVPGYGNMAYRVVGSYVNSDSFRDNERTKKSAVYPSFTWRITKDTELLAQVASVSNFTPGGFGTGYLAPTFGATATRIVVPANARIQLRRWMPIHVNSSGAAGMGRNNDL
jgi:3-hydroxybutyryl-CoA dehydrogenase